MAVAKGRRRGIYGRWPALSRGHVNVGYAQVLDIQVQTGSGESSAVIDSPFTRTESSPLRMSGDEKPECVLPTHVSRSCKIRDRRFGPTRVDRRRRSDCGRAPIEDCALRASALDKLRHLADHSRGRWYRRREAGGRLTAKAVCRVTCCEGSQRAWSSSAASTGRQRTAME